MSWRYLWLLGLFSIGCDTAESTLCAAGEVRTNGACVKPSGTPTNVRVSTVGFVPGTAKQATYAGPASTFVIRSAADDSVVFPDEPGAVGPAVNATDTGEPETHTVDFGDLNAPGEYYVDVDGVGRSVTFRIGDDVFVEPFQATMLGMYGMRCGAEVSLEWHGTTFGHKACHLADGPAQGGWHDAGDYGKYTNNGAFSLGMMLVAWDHFRSKLEGVTLPIPEQDNGIPDYLDECIYQANWLVGMQLDDGSVSDRITSANFDGMVMPEASNLPRMMAPASSKATADAAAALAHLARIVREFDADLASTYEDSATRAWQFLVDNPAAILPPKSGFTGSYGLGNNPDSDTDDRAWAAAEIFETTGDTGALAAFEAAGNGLSVQGYWDWDDVSNLGVFTYLTSMRDGRSQKVLDHLTASLKVTANSLAANSLGTSTTPAHAYGRSLANTYNWGINGTIARTTLALVVASKLAPENAKADLDAASLQLDHLFGRNYYGRSFVTGVGGDAPKHPHHRPSVADGIEPPWPGLLVGGSWAQSSMGQIPAPPADSWIDDSNNYQTNEVAINWNAPLIYALAAFLPDP